MLDSQVKQFLETVASGDHKPFSVVEARKNSDRMTQEFGGIPVPVVSIKNERVTAENIPIRIYTPHQCDRITIVYLHGGGWVTGNLDSCDNICRALANSASATVVSVGYRLSPEYPFPTPLNDCLAATQWTINNVERLGGDSKRIVIAGDSVGGGMAAVVARKLRDRLAMQVLLYPVTDATMSTQSYQNLGEGYYVSRETMEAYWKAYLGDLKTADLKNPDASVLYAEDLTGLPDTLIMVCEYDPLKDEAKSYADKLKQVGVNVELIEISGMIHGFLRFRTLDKARSVIEDIGDRLSRQITRTKAAVISRIEAKPGQEEILKQASIELGHATSQESGCRQYSFHQSTENKREFVFYEVFETQAALQAHLETDHTQVWFAKMKQIAIGSPQITPLSVVYKV